MKIVKTFTLLLITLTLNAQTIRLTEGFRYPFSYRGSYWTISRWTGYENEPKAVFLHDISRTGEMELFRFEITKNDVVQTVKYVQTPEKYSIQSEDGSVGFCFENPDVLRVKGKNADLRISYKKPVEIVPINEKQFRIMISSNRMVFTLLQGTFQIKREELGIKRAFHNPFLHNENLYITLIPNKDGVIECALERYVSEYKPRTYNVEFEQIVERNKQEFEDWINSFEAARSDFDNAMFDAAYISWMSLIKPLGNHMREAMMISKTWMNGIWSWDHCFNAVAMAYYHPQVAWDNLMCLFDHQDELGALPDAIYVNDLQWGHLKQPIHGWTLMQMMDIAPEYFTKDKLSEIYPKLEKWTNFWLTYRDDDGNGIVQINHGNDNFDHLPVYDMGFPVEDPHVNMMLAFQMETLGKAARVLGREQEAISWENKSKELILKIIERSWNGEKFIHFKAGTNEYIEESESVLHYTAMMMGERLPNEIQQKLVKNFGNANLTTDFGILTESRKSPLFNENTYTRGCIWPPLNLFIIEGLDACGEHKKAKELASIYINTMEKSGFAERFAAFSGAPLSDPSYTWTSSVYLILKEKFDF